MSLLDTRPELYFGSYRLDNVYEQVTRTLADEIVALWQESRVLTGAEARRRTAEVVLTIRDNSGTLVGVNSVYVKNFIKADNPYYFYRVFIRPQNRRSFGLRSFAGKSTREFLKSYVPSGHTTRPRGVIIIVENRKLTRPGAQRMLARQGWTPLGKGARGFELWCDSFDGSVESLPQRNFMAPR